MSHGGMTTTNKVMRWIAIQLTVIAWICWLYVPFPGVPWFVFTAGYFLMSAADALGNYLYPGIQKKEKSDG